MSGGGGPRTPGDTASDVRDFADHMVGQWSAARPDLDPGPMELVARILRVAALLEARLVRVVERHGLSLWEFDVLATLRRNPSDGLPPKRLLREMLLSSGAMTHRIDRLESAGLVERRPDPSDRRGTLVRLTDAGRARVDPIVRERFEDARAVADLLGGSGARQVAEGLRPLALGLQDEPW